jgi:hypothetical protein
MLSFVPLVNVDHALPFQCSIMLPSPVAHTSLDPLPQTLPRALVVPLAEADHALPFQCRIVPDRPTTQTSLRLLPQIAAESTVLPVVTDDHAVPFQCRVVPYRPTTQTSLRPLPQIAERSALVPVVTADHPVPFQCRIVPYWPTAHTSLGPLPHTPWRYCGPIPPADTDHALPFQCPNAESLQPTAHTSLGPLPQTAINSYVVPPAKVDQDSLPADASAAVPLAETGVAPPDVPVPPGTVDWPVAPPPPSSPGATLPPQAMHNGAASTKNARVAGEGPRITLLSLSLSRLARKYSGSRGEEQRTPAEEGLVVCLLPAGLVLRRGQLRPRLIEDLTTRPRRGHL